MLLDYARAKVVPTAADYLDWAHSLSATTAIAFSPALSRDRLLPSSHGQEPGHHRGRLRMPRAVHHRSCPPRRRPGLAVPVQRSTTGLEPLATRGFPRGRSPYVFSSLMGVPVPLPRRGQTLPADPAELGTVRPHRQPGPSPPGRPPVRAPSNSTVVASASRIRSPYSTTVISGRRSISPRQVDRCALVAVPLALFALVGLHVRTVPQAQRPASQSADDLRCRTALRRAPPLIQKHTPEQFSLA